jgi:hypothetical protein
MIITQSSSHSSSDSESVVVTRLAGLSGGVVVAGSLGTQDCCFFPEVSGINSVMVGKVRLTEGLNELDL